MNEGTNLQGTPLPHQEETHLLRLTAQGDEASFARLYDLFSGLVYGVAMRVLRDASAAEDVVQDVFLQLWRNPEVFDSQRGRLAPWLAVITRNRALDRLRRRRPEVEWDGVLAPVDVSFAATADRNIMSQRIRSALSSIPLEQRAALEMAFFEGMTQAEIAERTQTPLGTVKSRVRAAVNAVGKALRP